MGRIQSVQVVYNFDQSFVGVSLRASMQLAALSIPLPPLPSPLRTCFAAVLPVLQEACRLHADAPGEAQRDGPEPC